jgi:hypothetical protein
MTAQEAAEAAVGAVGCGYDLTGDLRLGRAKPVGRLVEIDAAPARARDLTLPGGAVVPGVPSGIVADKGERTRFRSDVLSFAQVRFRSFVLFSPICPCVELSIRSPESE